MADNDITLTAVILRERARLARFIRRRVPDAMDAEDVLQDVLTEFFDSFRLPRSIEHASGWLFQVARHRIIDRFRRKKAERLEEISGQDSENDAGDMGVLLAIEIDARPDTEYARVALLEALQDALDELPEVQREVFIAHELDGRSFKDLSRVTGVGINTLLARKRYAVLYLRSRLRAAFDEFEF